MQIVKILICVNTVCTCPIKRTLGLYGLIELVKTQIKMPDDSGNVRTQCVAINKLLDEFKLCYSCEMTTITTSSKHDK